ncbi:MAG: hypothetical protein MJZ73_03265 [Bacteroidaceae bacterium]|nr:hypothetical protein [Bacteroidaceae bacterium]
MRIIDFSLKNPVRITPLSGQTRVSVSTSGEVDITDAVPGSTSRERSITLADTGKGILSRSPKGLNRTIKITLPLVEASEMEFHRQVGMLFELARINSI